MASYWIALIVFFGIVGLTFLIIYTYYKWRDSEKQVNKRKLIKNKKDREEKENELRMQIIEDDERELISFTSFVYEDGNIYYFRILSRGSSNIFNDIKCYKKDEGKYIQIGDSEMIDVEFDSFKIKKECEQIMKKAFPQTSLKNWDGVVGDVPDWLVREAKLKNLLKNDTEKGEETR
ncbi:MAG: hypothetical protein SLAVMIC_01002 [uncultured marine phage]|uniref:Uncharacterized protein n=1 Tax=uncultured marine phage TaxID=707152 RepID=A0A8D9FQP7_9VIRU|nr:MAG: hypothetical protein SLAVMIC_01002 [uncultured marine phage]